MPKIPVNQIELYYELHGPEDAPVLVLNNGILMNAAASWALQTPALARHYRVLQYDCRGQGQSDHPDGDYSMEQHAGDLAGLLDALGIQNAHIAGISYGGEVAQAFAIAYPARVRSLILADTVSEIGLELRIAVQSWLDAAKTCDGGFFFDATVPWNFSPQWVRDHPTQLEATRKRYEQLDFAAVVRLCEAFLKLDLTSQLGAIQAPTCILYGELDILKGQYYAQILKRSIPQAEVHCLLGAGHASCIERPEEFNTAILGFLAKQL